MPEIAHAVDRPLRFRVGTTSQIRGPVAWVVGLVRGVADAGVAPWWLLVVDDASAQVVVSQRFDGLFAPRTDPLSDAILERDRLRALAEEPTWDDWIEQCAFAPKLPSTRLYEWIDGDVRPAERCVCASVS